MSVIIFILDNEQDVHMISDSYEENGYCQDLDL